jgi:beta-lactamase class A
LRGVEDIKAFEAGLNNTSCAFGSMVIFEKIAEGKAVSKKASMEMIKILSIQKLKNIIHAKLPHDLKIALKTGNLTGCAHDSVIVYLPNGKKYVIVLIAKDLIDVNAGSYAESEVSEITYYFMMRC